MVKNPLANAGDTGDVGLTPGSGGSPGGENGNPLQYSCLENRIDRGAWRVTVPGVAKSRTRLKLLSSSSSKEVMGFLGGSVVKNPPADAGDGGLFPGLGECPGEGNGNPL